MKNKELKTIWKLTKIIWISGTLFWIVEKVMFLIIENWHYKAINPTEIYFDLAVSKFLEYALFLTAWICVNLLINLTKKK